MFALGWKELVCVAVYAAFVRGGHALFRSAGPPAKRAPLPPRSRSLRGDLLRAAIAFAAAFAIGLFLAGRLMPDAAVPPLVAIFLSSPAWIALVSRDSPRSSLVPASVFVLGGVLGALFVLPAAGRKLLWDAILGPGLILLAAPLSFRAARLARSAFFTPALMLTAAVATASTGVYVMTLVFLPMCVAAMAGIGMAEVVDAHSHGRKLGFSRIGGWGLRLMAESVLGAVIAAAIIVLWR